MNTMQNTRVSIETWLNLFALDLSVVMLIVLLIFMTTVPFMDPPIYVDVPTSSSAQKSPESGGDLTISVPRPGFLVFREEVLSLAELDRRIAAAPRDAYTTVRIRAARDVPYGTVRRLVQSARQAGYTRVTFVVGRPKSPIETYEETAWPCPPDYAQVTTALLFAAIAFVASIWIPMRLRKRYPKPGCIGWLFLIITAFALIAAWDGWWPSCGLWTLG
jgi:biopolymer transport protein TolR